MITEKEIILEQKTRLAFVKLLEILDNQEKTYCLNCPSKSIDSCKESKCKISLKLEREIETINFRGFLDSLKIRKGS